MISKQHKCVFIHIPKTAGQSVEHFFLSLLGIAWKERSSLLLGFNADSSRGPERLAHLTAEEYLSCGHMSEKEFGTYFKFSFVRNPWARLVSEYHYGDYDRKYSFRQFVLSGLPERNLYSNSYRHIIPQSDFIYDSAGNLIVDYVGKFENLQQDFDVVCAKLEISSTTLPYVNASSQSVSAVQKIMRLLNKSKNPRKLHFTQYYDEETQSAVRAMYARDIVNFGYEFGD